MGCIVLVLGVGRCAFRPPRVVFVLGLVSLINSLTSGKKRRFFTSGTGKEKKKLGAAGAVRRPETNGGEIRFFRRIVLHLGPPHPLTISGGARAPS